MQLRHMTVVVLIFGLAAILASSGTHPVSFTAVQANRTPTLELTYIANEGFLLAGAGKKVLLDALFHRGYPGYVTAEQDTLARLEAASPPFDAVDLVLVTHFDPDHFEAETVGRHLTDNPRGVFVAPRQAVDVLKQRFAAFERVSARVNGITPRAKESALLQVAGIEVKVLRLTHRDLEHSGFLVTLSGRKLLHLGDWDFDGKKGELAPYRLADERIDIALVPYWILLQDEWKHVARVHIRAKGIIAIHIPYENPTDPEIRQHLAEYGGRTAMLEKIRAQYPDVIFALNPGEAWRF